ncbi:MAG: RNA polymerase sigma factor [candidate division WOR-3 bacterium]|nr:RNA polymerase sigma factor [candidate division WOR-3 bacterium]
MSQDEKIKFFNHIIESYANYIYNIVYYSVLNEEDTKELVQDIFYKIWKGLDNFKNKSSLKTWIYRITQNHIKNYFRKKKLRKIISLEFLFEEKHMDFEMEENPYPYSIEYLLSKLPEDYRRVIVLFYFEDYDIKEIASILNMNENTVKSKLHRAREKLKKLWRLYYET